jgi:hypothetical protein
MKNRRNHDSYHFDDDEVEDGRSVRVPMAVMDGNRVNLVDTVRFDADDQPHFLRAVESSNVEDLKSPRLVDLRTARDAARAARDAWIKQLGDAWRTPPRGARDAAEPDAAEALLRRAPAPHDDPAAALHRHLWGPDDDAAPDPGDIGAVQRRRLTEQQRERDLAWIRYRDDLQNAWKTPPRAAAAIENRLERERGRGGASPTGGR